MGTTELMAASGPAGQPAIADEAEPPPENVPLDPEPDLRVVVDRTIFHVKSLYLTAQSPVFRQMLSSGMLEGLAEEISLPGKEAVGFELFYSFLNLSNQNVFTFDSALTLSSWADEYQVEGLKSHCDAFLAKESKEASVDLLLHSSKYKLQLTMAKCLRDLGKDLNSNIKSLQALTRSAWGEEPLRLLWPAICKWAKLDPSAELPPREALDELWPFMERAIHQGGHNQVLLRLRDDIQTWAAVFDDPSGSTEPRPATKKARSWIQQKAQEVDRKVSSLRK